MDQKQIIRIAERYAEAVTNNFSVQKIVLYGSYVNGIPTEDSDIDIAVIMKSVKGDLLTAKAKLYKLRRDIDDRIEPILITEGEDPSGFLKKVLNTGEVIFESAKWI
jgi:uncharacterized protein